MGAHMRSPHEKFILMLLGVSVRAVPLGSHQNPPEEAALNLYRLRGE